MVSNSDVPVAMDGNTKCWRGGYWPSSSYNEAMIIMNSLQVHSSLHKYSTFTLCLSSYRHFTFHVYSSRLSLALFRFWFRVLLYLSPSVFDVIFCLLLFGQGYISMLNIFIYGELYCVGCRCLNNASWDLPSWTQKNNTGWFFCSYRCWIPTKHICERR